ncbi:MAG: CDP-alcohol phosphatidyltransferase family protein [Victivallales bacterium]|nr:CDP-alcohol phosphatidyltransferase family protein [Victivallales bacterium]
MEHLWCIVALVLAMLGLERLFVVGGCHNSTTREWIRKCPLCHPNTISLMRLPMGFIACWIAYKGNWSFATLWFAFWMITDLSDGTIARHCNLGTETGKWLDPLSDKCMYFPVLLFFAFSKQVKIPLDPIPVIAFVIIDVIGQVSRLFVKKKAANLFGKAKTALVTILLSISALHQIHDLPFINSTFLTVFLYACLILAFLSCYCKIIPDEWYANTFTLVNFLCGLTAIYYACHNKYIHCMVCVFIGQFFDLFDGRLARRFGSTKRGAMFDDIADGTDFGAAIGAMIFFILKDEVTTVSSWLAAVIALFYVFCVLYRLYRFLKPTKEMPRGVFQGLPSPAGAMFAGSMALASQEIGTNAAGIVAAVLVVFASLLMISNVPYCHFGQTMWPNMPRFLKLLLFLFIIILTVFAITHKSWRPTFVWFCVGITLVYLIYGIQSVCKLSCKLPEPPPPKD